jgi:hypothetical protein
MAKQKLQLFLRFLNAAKPHLAAVFQRKLRQKSAAKMQMVGQPSAVT